MRIFFFLVLLFPVLELVLLIKVGGSIGVLATLMLLLLSGLIGVLFVRLAGFSTAWRARERIARGELPEQEMLHGLMMTLGGGLLILPGFLSDLLGVLILLPWTRYLLLKLVQLYIERKIGQQQRYTYEARSKADQTHSHTPHTPNVIEGEWERRDK